MKYLFSICLLFLFSCNSGTNDTNQNLPDPLKENPEADAIPNDMEIKNDSNVKPNPAVADTVPFMDTSKMNHKD